MNTANNTAKQTTTSNAQDISLEGLHQTWKDLPGDSLIVDIRAPEDYQASHVPGSKNIPYPSVMESLDEIGQFNNVIFYCYGGMGSKEIATNLAEQGFENISFMGQAGFSDWQDAGYPVN